MRKNPEALKNSSAVRRRALLAIPLLGVVLFSGCGKDKKKDLAVRSDSSGVEIIRNTGKYRKIVWAFDTAFIIGGVGDTAFKRVRAHTVAVSPDGHIMVLDTDLARLDVYDQNGALVKRLEKGNNHLSIPSAVVLHGNEFAVYDVGDWSLVSFTSDGTYVGKGRAPRQFTDGVLRSDSTAFVLAQRVRDSKTNTPIISIVRVTAQDTTSIIAAAIEDAGQVALPICGGVTLMLPPIFSGPPAWTAGHGMTAVAEAPLYGVRLYRGTKEFRRVRRGVEPEESSNQYAVLASEPGKTINSPDGTTCTIPAVEVARASGWKEVIPTIGAISIANDGGLWVQRVDPGHSRPAVDIIDASGEYVGTLPLKTPWPVGFLPNGNPIAMDEDTAGNTQIIAYRINKNPAPVRKVAKN
ncbi:MAG: hypothetical protein ABIV28_04365 [Longimicrobiales bacterium]